MFDLGLLVVVVLRRAAVDVVREAIGAAGSADVRGDFDRVGPLPLAPRNGEAVLLMPGVPEREGGLLGLLIEGLSQEEKKSSGSPAGVLVPLPSSASAASSTTTLSGFLQSVSLVLQRHTSHSTRRTSSGQPLPFAPAHPCTCSLHCSCTSSWGPCSRAQRLHHVIESTWSRFRCHQSSYVVVAPIAILYQSSQHPEV
jgi:hypothetical protein